MIALLIEVQDECGGLPAGKVDEMFRPFEQLSTERMGLGLGLPVSRRGVEANGGNLAVRNLPGTACVFTIDLPRAATARRTGSEILRVLVRETCAGFCGTRAETGMAPLRGAEARC